MARDTEGNIAVDFVWGNMPMQPDDDREDALDPALDGHIIASSNYNGFPDYTPSAPYLDTITNVTVPNVVGKTEAAAETDLVAADLILGTVSSTLTGATTVNDGKVKSQSPAAASLVNTGAPVAVVLYAAPLVPDVTEMTEEDAEAALVEAGLAKGAVTTSATGASAENDGLVKSSNPAADTKVNAGSTVALVLYAFGG